MRSRMIASSPVEASPISNCIAASVARNPRRMDVSSSTSRTVPCVLSITDSLVIRQGKYEGCFVSFAFHPSTALMRFGYLLDDRQPEPGAGGTADSVRPTVEAFEDAIALLSTNSTTEVGDTDQCFHLSLRHRDLDPATNPRVFDRVID